MKKIDNLPNIDINLVNTYIYKFNNENLQYDNIIKKIIYIYPNNKSLDEILIKVILLNHIYNTNIFHIYQLASDIYNLDIDRYLMSSDVDLVHKISYSHKISKNIYCYSFATKYCNFHNKNYPIFDSIVEKILYLYMIKDKFSNFKKYELRDYNKFITTLIDFKNFYKLNTIDYKDLDKFLWQFGKTYLKM